MQGGAPHLSEVACLADQFLCFWQVVLPHRIVCLMPLQAEYKELVNRQIRQQQADTSGGSGGASVADDPFLQGGPSALVWVGDRHASACGIDLWFGRVGLVRRVHASGM